MIEGLDSLEAASSPVGVSVAGRFRPALAARAARRDFRSCAMVDWYIVGCWTW